MFQQWVNTGKLQPTYYQFPREQNTKNLNHYRVS